MADSDATTVRQRKPAAAAETDEAATKPSPSKPKSRADDEDAYSPWLDVLRVLTFLFIASCGLSYLISSGETWFWGMKNPPGYLRADWWKSQLVCHHCVIAGCTRENSRNQSIQH